MIGGKSRRWEEKRVRYIVKGCELLINLSNIQKVIHQKTDVWLCNK